MYKGLVFSEISGIVFFVVMPKTTKRLWRIFSNLDLNFQVVQQINM